MHLADTHLFAHRLLLLITLGLLLSHQVKAFDEEEIASLDGLPLPEPYDPRDAHPDSDFGN